MFEIRESEELKNVYLRHSYNHSVFFHSPMLVTIANPIDKMQINYLPYLFYKIIIILGIKSAVYNEIA